MRLISVWVMLGAVACHASWQRTNAPGLQGTTPDLLFVVTSGHAYELEDTAVEGDVIRGRAARAWQVTSEFRGVPDTKAPEDIAAQHGWPAADAPREPVAIRVADVRYVSRGEEPNFTAPLLAVAGLIVVTFLFILVGGGSGS